MNYRIIPIEVNVVLSVNGYYNILSGFSTKTVLGYSINDIFTLNKTEENLVDIMTEYIFDKLSCLPLFVEQKNDFTNSLHYHGDLNEDLKTAYREQQNDKVYNIYLCIH